MESPSSAVRSGAFGAAGVRSGKATTSSAAAFQLWEHARETRGAKLPANPAVLLAARAGGREIKGRSAPFDARFLAVLGDLAPGEAVVLPLLGGEEVTGRVNLVQADAGNWIRVGGELTGVRAGSFALSANENEVGGTILLKDEGIAIEIMQAADGSVTMEEKPVGDVLCTPMPLPPEKPMATNNPGGAGNPAVAAAAPLLSSRPNATAVIYLDFDGETVTDPRWNSGLTIVAAPASIDAVGITEVWARVKEDYWAFNVDVTTDVSRYNNAPASRRTRCIITPTSTAAPGSGGVAYINSFNRAGSSFSATIPCWVFVTGAKNIAEAASHEVGHTLGLRHDGRTIGEEYYTGHDGGAVGWAPIMGVGYYRELVQWSKGEYALASRTEDDIAIITASTNGFGFVPDDAGDTRGTAATLSFAGNAINQEGIVSQASDSDFYSLTVGAGANLNLTASPAAVGSNADLLVELQDANGTVLASANPDSSLDAALSLSLPSGTYFIKVAGMGRGNVLVDGYSSYGSIGAYTLSGTLVGGAQAPTIGGLSNVNASAGFSTSPMAFTVGDADTNVNALALSASSSNPSLVPDNDITLGGGGVSRTVSLTPALGQSGSATITVTVSDGALTSSASFVVTVASPPSGPLFTLNPSGQTVTVGGSVTFTAAAMGTPAPAYQWLKNSTPIAGANSAAYTISAASVGDAGSYSVTASNIAGSATSQAAALTVNNGPQVVGSPLSGTTISSGPYSGIATYGGTKAFDRDTESFFAGSPSDVLVYVGRDLGGAHGITRIRYFPRSGYAWRMNGGTFRGANTANLSDAVTLYTIAATPPEGLWQDVTLPAVAASYRYVFFTTASYNEANVAELEFYGSGASVVGPPQITGQPQSQTANEGASASFSVTHNGGAATYQWFKNGNAIGGATNATYQIPVVLAADAGTYSVEVTNAGGSTPSGNATLAVQPIVGLATLLSGTTISSGPWSGIATYVGSKAFDGDTGSFFAGSPSDVLVYVGRDLGGAHGITRIRYFPRGGYAWRMNGGTFRGANTANLSDAVTLYTIAATPPEGLWQDVTLPAVAASYRYVFFTTASYNEANVAELEFYGSGASVVGPPQITGQPQSQTANEGASASFSVTHNGGAATYQWFKNGNAIGGATNATYQIPVVLAADAGTYSVEVTNAGGSTASGNATLAVQPIGGGATLLSGTTISSGPWSGIATYVGSKAFDGDTGSFFAGSPSDVLVYVGRDLGGAHGITRIRYFPRSGYAWRMNGGTFRGANTANLSDAVTLYTIAATPPEGLWQDVTLPAVAASYRYVFFTTASYNEANVAELQFYGYAAAGGAAEPTFLSRQPHQEIVEGESATFSAGVASEGATFQWFKDGVAIPGADQTVYRINVVLAEDAGLYTVTVKDTSGRTTINAVIVTVQAIILTEGSRVETRSRDLEGEAEQFSIGATTTVF